MIEYLHALVGVSTYLTLSFLFMLYRRPLEQLLAEEILTGGKGRAARDAFKNRLERSSRAERKLHWMLRYGFPNSSRLMLRTFETARFLLWPLFLLLSVRFYLRAALKPETLLEIYSDI